MMKKPYRQGAFGAMMDESPFHPATWKLMGCFDNMALGQQSFEFNFTPCSSNLGLY